eukprot:m51a1_g9739 hypothetical protein (429) ;mRNA; r:1542418-1548597
MRTIAVLRLVVAAMLAPRSMCQCEGEGSEVYDAPSYEDFGSVSFDRYPRVCPSADFQYSSAGIAQVFTPRSVPWQFTRVCFVAFVAEEDVDDTGHIIGEIGTYAVATHAESRSLAVGERLSFVSFSAVVRKLNESARWITVDLPQPLVSWGRATFLGVRFWSCSTVLLNMALGHPRGPRAVFYTYEKKWTAKMTSFFTSVSSKLEKGNLTPVSRDELEALNTVISQVRVAAEWGLAGLKNSFQVMKGPMRGTSVDILEALRPAACESAPPPDAPRSPSLLLSPPTGSRGAVPPVPRPPPAYTPSCATSEAILREGGGREGGRYALLERERRAVMARIAQVERELADIRRAREVRQRSRSTAATAGAPGSSGRGGSRGSKQIDSAISTECAEVAVVTPPAADDDDDDEAACADNDGWGAGGSAVGVSCV